MRRRGAVVAAAAAAALAVPEVAAAYVRNHTSTGAPLAWRMACRDLEIAPSAAAPPAAADLRDVLDRAIANWRTRTERCTRLDARLRRGAAGADDVGYDGTNVVVWRSPGFCDDPAHAARDVCGAPQAAAVTTLFFIDKPGDPRDGELLDVDIAINGIDFRFGAGGVDLESVLTHELGHYLGLGHVCHTDRGSDPPTDHTGERIPYCYPLSQLRPELLDATMFNFIAPGETNKREPQEDEWRGVCAIYADHPGTCDPDLKPGGCGCSSGPGAGAAGLLIVLATAPVLLSRRRR